MVSDFVKIEHISGIDEKSGPALRVQQLKIHVKHVR